MRTVTTNPDGRYEFRQLPEGEFAVVGSAPGFLDTWFGAPVGTNLFTPVQVGPDLIITGIDLVLTRTSAITGRVTNERGEPVPNAAVTLLVSDYRDGSMTLRPLAWWAGFGPTRVDGEATTDTDGIYQFSGLRPGRYFVAVSAVSTSTGRRAGDNGIAEGYPLVLHPGVTAPTAARRVDLGAAETLAGIDIALPGVPLVTVSGSVFGLQGEVSTRGTVQLFPRNLHMNLSGIDMRTAPVMPDGSFAIRNVPPGSYSARAVGVADQRRATEPPAYPFAIVTVSDGPLAGVSLRPPSPVTVSGRVVFEQLTTLMRPAPTSLFVVPQAWNSDDGQFGVAGTSGGRRPSLNRDGSFALRTVPGLITFRVMGLEQPQPDWQVKSIHVGGRDVTDTAIPLDATGLNDIYIILTDTFPRVTGRVTMTGSYRNVRVLLFASDRSHWRLPTNRYFAIAAPDSGGYFAVSTLPPGDYHAVAVHSRMLEEWRSPGRLDALARDAPLVSFAAGTSPWLDLQSAE